MRLKSKVALITGANSGIGNAIAKLFVKEGSHVILVDIKEGSKALENIQKAKADHVKVHFMTANISNENEVERMIDEAINIHGRTDILVNNAGILTQSPLENMSIDMWDEMIRVNLRGTFLCCKYILPYMLENEFGRIINISSQLAQIGGVDLTHYCAAKAGVIGFTKSLAREVGDKGITVNCIAPGPTETNLIKDLSDEWKTEKKKELVIPRFGKPEEIAPTALFLASEPDGNLYTGQTLGPNSGDVML